MAARVALRSPSAPLRLTLPLQVELRWTAAGRRRLALRSVRRAVLLWAGLLALAWLLA